MKNYFLYKSKDLKKLVILNPYIFIFLFKNGLRLMGIPKQTTSSLINNVVRLASGFGRVGEFCYPIRWY